MTFKSDTLFARQRIIISNLIIWPLAAVAILTSSGWEQNDVIEGAIFTMGCMMVGVATIGRLWCSLYICGKKTKQLVTTGPYSTCRNPLYFFSAIGAIGVGLVTETFTIPIIVSVLFSLVYPAVIRAEEAKLRERHGDAYIAYMSTVPRFWPSFAHFREPDEYLISPIKFRRAMFDAFWFIWLMGIIEFAEALREAKILITMLMLY